MQAKFFETAFNCPYCISFNQQRWLGICAHWIDIEFIKNHPHDLMEHYKNIQHITLGDSKPDDCITVDGAHLSECTRCNRISIWQGDKLVYPAPTSRQHPSFDMPDEVKADFTEAASIAHLSPRGAAGLLRLALEKLCHHLGDPNKKIDTNIKAFVADGLSVKVQQALDAVRVIGNEAVHPGEMDLKDDQETVDILFGLVNLIVRSMITEPNHVEAIYAKLPEAKRAGIENRDKKPDC